MGYRGWEWQRGGGQEDTREQGMGATGNQTIELGVWELRGGGYMGYKGWVWGEARGERGRV